MFLSCRPRLTAWTPLFLLFILAACDRLTLPRMTYDDRPVSVVPITVKYEFDDAVARATIKQTVCADQPWEGPLGQLIIKNFYEQGRRRFARVSTGLTNTAEPASGPADVTAVIRLAKASFQPMDRTGSLDQYLAQIDIELSAAVQNGAGQTVGATPLIYSNQVSIWTPQYGGSGTLCPTTRLDAALRDAAEHLADQMNAAIFRFGQQPQAVAALPAPVQPPIERQPSLTLHATLLDQNDNQIVEGGEKIGVRIDVTNAGTTRIPSVAATLSGTPVLLDAFSSGVLSQPEIGSLGPGETKSITISGTMPAVNDQKRGELTVTVTTGAQPAINQTMTQTLVVAIKPGLSRPSRPPRTPSR